MRGAALRVRLLTFRRTRFHNEERCPARLVVAAAETVVFFGVELVLTARFASL